MNVADRPCLGPDEVGELAAHAFRVRGTTSPLAGERDQNVRVDADDGAAYVLKIAHPDERRDVLELQNAALTHLGRGARPDLFPRVIPDRRGETITTVEVAGRSHLVRLVTWLDGTPAAEIAAHPPARLDDVGARLAVMDRELARFAHPAMHRLIPWDTKHAFSIVRERAGAIADDDRRGLVAGVVDAAEARLVPLLPDLRSSVIHNDVNDHNLLVGDDGRVAGIIDFGDMVHTYTACELANAAAYLMLDADDPVGVLADLARAYHRHAPLAAAELAALRDLVLLRLGLSVTMAAWQRRQDPHNAYLGVTEAPAWALLDALAARPDAEWTSVTAIGAAPRRRPRDELARARRDVLSRTLSVSYRTPLKIVRGAGQHLYDDADRRYLDCVNNVAHVGHGHPRVVAAAAAQMATLNTNTRYLHDAIVEYAERLTATLPDPLAVCFLVNSGSEANDLALRLARTHTGASDLVVVDHAYHGHTQSLVDASPYKHDGPGGRGAPPTTHVVPIPDRYRGPHGYDDPDAGRRYADSVRDAVGRLVASGRTPAAFIVESFPGCAGQIELPPGYLEHAFAHVRGAGGVCIADEVQVGFGRVGSHLWAFETQDVVPDVVTMGKPIGNGHPLGAVVTTRAVAESFETGMEYFNTFGGNPVSCAAGLAVLDVVADEGLPEHAREVGGRFLAGLRDLATRHPLIGDVRGRGLFLGVELVRDRATREPATDEATEVVERMKDAGVLLSTDGPFANVLKIKPPMVITRDDVDLVVATLDECLRTRK
jgi:4-aminobutyrate aminotransferase-like enzyme